MVSFLGTYWVWIVFGGVMIAMHKAHGHGGGGHKAQGHGCGGHTVAGDRNDAGADQISPRVDKHHDPEDDAAFAVTPVPAIARKGDSTTFNQPAPAGRRALNLQNGRGDVADASHGSRGLHLPSAAGRRHSRLVSGL